MKKYENMVFIPCDRDCRQPDFGGCLKSIVENVEQGKTAWKLYASHVDEILKDQHPNYKIEYKHEPTFDCSTKQLTLIKVLMYIYK